METTVQKLFNTYERIGNEYLIMKQINKACIYFNLSNNAKDYIEEEKQQYLDLIRFMRTNDKMGKTVEDLYNEFLNQNK